MAAAPSEASSGASGGDSTVLDGTALLRADGDVLDDSRTLQVGMWGVLYTVSKEKGRTALWFVIFRLFMDFLQLCLLTVNPAYGFDIPAKAMWWRVISFVQLNDFMSARGYTFFIISLYLMVAGLAFAVALSVWVAWSFRNNNFSHVWPITVLRAFATIFFQILDIASMTLFLMALDCQYFDINPPHERYHNAEFPSVECWTMPHLVHVFVAIASLIVFVIMAALFQMGDMELNLATRNPLAMAHSKVEVLAFFMKFIMTAASVFVNNAKWLSVVQLFFSLWLLQMYIKWVPHYYNFTNHIRIASYAAVFWSAICFFVVAFHFGIKRENLPHFQHIVTMLMWYGLAPAGLAGAAASFFRLRFFQRTVLHKFRDAREETPSVEIFTFDDAREVEIVARCCRVFVDVRGNLEPGAVSLADKIVQAGLEQLPKSAFMIIFHSSFLIDVQQSYQSGYKQLQAAKKMDPSMLERFAIFTREQQHTQKSSGGGVGGATVDLVAYVEFQRNYNLVLKVHRDALLSMRYFWMQLMHTQVPFQSLSKAVENMDKTIRDAERAYRMVLQRHSTNVKMVRLYAKFLEHVKHDPWGAAKWFAEADKLEVQEDEMKEHGILQKLQLDPELQDAFLATRGTGAGDPGGSAGVVLINAQGVILMANDALNQVFGYQKKELQGKNVSILMPPPFSGQHDGYLRQHVTTGRSNIMGRINNLLGLHKDRRILPVSVQVYKVSGSGEDSLFLGILEVAPAEDNTGTIWILPSGKVMSTDAAYTDMCGFKATDVADSPVAMLLKDKTELVEILKLAREVAMAATSKPAEAAETVSNTAENSFSVGPHDEEAVMLASTRSNTKRVFAPRNNTAQRYNGVAAKSGNLSFAPSQASATSVKLPKLGSVFRSNKSLASVVNTVMSGKSSSKWTASNVHMNHKFAEPFLANITVSNGGIGMHTFHVLTIVRQASPTTKGSGLGGGKRASRSESGNQPAMPVAVPPDLMLVSDTKGRIVHVTEALAAQLGTNANMLMANGANRAIESLIMEPLGTLHTKYVANPPAIAPPPYSCRAGLSVMLTRRAVPGLMKPVGEEGGAGAATAGGANDGDFTAIVPVRMNIKKKLIDGQLHHIANLTEVTPLQAVNERRLLLRVAENGTILRVGRDTPTSLFGFDAQTLTGRNISCIIDALRPDKTKDITSADLLTEVAIRSVDNPGVSWRVGVTPPEDSSAAIDGRTLAGRLVNKQARPAVMRIFVRTGATVTAEESMFSQAPSHSSFDAEDEADQQARAAEEAASEAQPDGVVANGMLELDVSEPQSSRQQPSQPLALDAQDHADSPRMPHNGTLEDALVQAARVLGPTTDIEGTHQMELPAEGYGQPADEDGLAIELDVELWRADTLAGFLQVDSKGFILEASNSWETLVYDAGLVLGIDPGRIPGLPLSSIIPQLKDKPPSELFNPRLAEGPDGQQLKRGALKTNKKKDDSNKVGVQHVLNGIHGADDHPIGLLVQAVQRANGYWVIIRPSKPQCSHRDFREWLLDSPLPPERQSPAPSQPPVQRKVAIVQDAPTLPTAESPEPPALAGVPVPVVASNGLPLPTALTRAVVALAASPTPPDAPRTDLPEGPRASAGLAVKGHEVHDVSASRGASRAESRAASHAPSRAISRAASRNARKQYSIKSWVMSRGAVYPVDADGDDVPPDEGQRSTWVGFPSPRAEATVAWDEPAPDDNKRSNGRALRPSVSIKEEATKYEAGRNGDDGSSGQGSSNDNDDDDSDDIDGSAVDGVGGASMMDDATKVDNMVDDQEYSRGQRFKKILRILGSPAVQKTKRIFYKHTLVVMFLLLAVHIGLFALMFILLRTQKENVAALNNIGRAATLASELAVTARQVYIVMNNQSVPGLRGMSSRDDLEDLMALLKLQASSFMDLHQGALLGFNGKQKRMTSAHGLLDLWQTPTLTEYQYTAVAENQNEGNDTIARVIQQTGKLSLFRLGTRVVFRALDMVSNGVSFQESGNSLELWTPLLYTLTNYEKSLAPAYLQTMDLMMSYTIDLAKNVNQAHLIILIVEGLVVCIGAMTYVAIVASKLANHRYSIYNVFMLVPQSLVRQLATKRMNLTDEDEEEEDVAMLAAKNAANATSLNPITLAANNARGPAAKVGEGNAAIGAGAAKGDVIAEDVIKADAPQKGKVVAMLSRVLSSFPSLLGRRAALATKSQKRQLLKSHRRTVILISLFALWGTLVVIINAMGHQSLKNINSPIATYNIASAVNVLYVRAFFYLQELSLSYNPDFAASYRSTLASKLSEFNMEYAVMCYGNWAAPDSLRDTPHFAPVKEGIAYSLKGGADVLFWTDKCLAEDPSYCVDASSPLYDATMNGLNGLFVRFTEQCQNAMASPFPDPALRGPQYVLSYNLRPHMVGAFAQLNLVYKDYVISVYTQVLVTHIILLILTLLIFATFLLFVLRPFMRQIENEPRRIAELLSQLPPDVDVDTLLQQIVLKLPTAVAGQPQQQQQQQKQQPAMQPTSIQPTPSMQRTLQSPSPAAQQQPQV